MGGFGRVVATMTLAVGVPAGMAGQTCSADARIGSLGITAIQCERCRFFSRDEGRAPVFWTEPIVRGLDPTLPGSDILREGDAIVAIDGALITTNRGQEAYARLPGSGEVRVRVRRDGETRELSVPVASVCPSSPSLAPVIAGRTIPVPPVAPAAVLAPTPPTPPSPAAAAVPATPATPPVPPVPAGPDARLGFGFRCGPCSSHRSYGETTWTFSNPLEVTGVPQDGPAWEAGMRPGDRILRIDGIDVTRDEGGRRFGAIAPGDLVRWTLERDGRTFEVTSRALAPEPAFAPRAEPATGAPVIPDVLRYSGRVGDALIEVRGARVVVVEDGPEIVIRTGDTEVRVRVAAPRRR
jgi:membrane-associated protease RseP (regulator of RpoE activity)